MPTLQELFDFYQSTGPTEWKLRNATKLLIHACQALKVNSAEEIDQELLAELPDALDQYFAKAPQKAVHDKGTLAEMIGRFGPIDGLGPVLEKLLNDKDKNLRQFTLQSLEYHARNNLNNVLPILEHYKNDCDLLMKQVSAIVLARLSSSLHYSDVIKNLMQNCAAQNDVQYLQMMYDEVNKQIKNCVESVEIREKYIQMKQWMETQFEFLK